MSKQPATVLLRNLDNQQSQPFEASHAERLLAYPGSRWAAIAEGEAGAPKLRPAARKTVAGAPSPEVDATGHPTSN